jgi:hypothetical protein
MECRVKNLDIPIQSVRSLLRRLNHSTTSVCTHLLTSVLPRSSTDKRSFVIRGSHTTITGCSLPDGLPLTVLRTMVSFFGDQLRKVLIELLEERALVRGRSLSTGTQRFSPVPVYHWKATSL